MKKVENISRKVGKWLNGRSETVSKFCDEDFTRKEVIKAHLGLIAFFLVMGFADAHPLLSLVIISIIAFIVIGSAGDDEKEHA